MLQRLFKTYLGHCCPCALLFLRGWGDHKDTLPLEAIACTQCLNQVLGSAPQDFLMYLREFPHKCHLTVSHHLTDYGQGGHHPAR